MNVCRLGKKEKLEWLRTAAAAEIGLGYVDCNDQVESDIMKVLVGPGADPYQGIWDVDLISGKKIGRASCRERVSSPV